MSRETEKVFKEFQKYLENKETNSDEEMKCNIVDFMEMYNNKPKNQKLDADDYLGMAYEADTEEEALKYAKKALKLDKNCIDAEAMVSELTSYNPDDLQKKYEKLIKKEEKRLKDSDIFNEESIGEFWIIHQTRPYMRLRNSYVRLLIDQGKFKKAINECENLLELSEGDNLGIRYLLMGLYAFFEDELNANKLLKKYHNEATTRFYLPMIALYYKLDNYKKAETYFKKLCEVNDEVKEVFSDTSNPMDMDEVIDTGMYRPGSKEEIMISMMDSSFLYTSASGFMFWITERTIK